MRELAIGQYPAGELAKEKSELRWSLAEHLVAIACLAGLAVTLELARRWKLLDRRLAWSGIGVLSATGVVKVVGSVATVKQLQRGHVEQTDAPQLGRYMPVQCEFIEGGVASLAQRRKLINSAQHEIKISGNYCGGKVFDDLLKDEITAALIRGVRIELITSSDFLTDKNREKLRYLEKTYDNFHVLIYAPRMAVYPRVATYENHVKLTIVDGHIVQTGGVGIQDALCANGDGQDDSSQYEVPLGPRIFVGSRGMRDSDILITSNDFAALAADQFNRLWAKWGGKPNDKLKYAIPQAVGGGAQVALHVGGPEQGEQNSWKHAVLKEIDQTQSSQTIKIMGMAFHEDEIINALVIAENRGVNIEIITNGYRANSPTGNFFQGPVHKLHYHKLKNIREFDRDKTIYHKKVWIFERGADSITIHGSANINYLSTHCDDELIVKVKSDKVLQETRAAFEADKKFSTPVTDRSGSLKGRVLDAVLRYHIF